MAKKQKESNISEAIRVELGKKGCRLFRSQVGLFYTQYGEMIHIGIKGESDLHGHRADGRAVYIETKTPIGKARPEQIQFIEAMKKSNALAGFARSVEDALKIVFPANY